MLSFNEISNFPLLPWERKRRRKKKPNSHNFSPDESSKEVSFLYTTEKITISCFFLLLQYICGLEFGSLSLNDNKSWFNSFSKMQAFPTGKKKNDMIKYYYYSYCSYQIWYDCYVPGTALGILYRRQNYMKLPLICQSQQFHMRRYCLW